MGCTRVSDLEYFLRNANIFISVCKNKMHKKLTLFASYLCSKIAFSPQILTIKTGPGIFRALCRTPFSKVHFSNWYEFMIIPKFGIMCPKTENLNIL